MFHNRPCCFNFLYLYLPNEKKKYLELAENNFKTIILRANANALEVNKKLNHKINTSWERLFLIIAHDLRGPYNTMLGYTNLLLSNFDKLERQDIKNHLITIQKAALKNYELTENLLSWAILQRGGLKVTKQKIDIKEIVDQSASIYLEMAKQKDIQLINRCSAGLIGNLDKNIVSIVLSNLIHNSLKFTSKKGTVTVSARKINSDILFKVDDNGLGMPESVTANLYKLDKVNSRVGTANEQSTGLGLILCKELIAIHRGKIRIKSLVGKGTTVLALFK